MWRLQYQCKFFEGIQDACFRLPNNMRSSAALFNPPAAPENAPTLTTILTTAVLVQRLPVLVARLPAALALVLT